MLTRRSTSMLAPLVTLAFSAVLVLPCFCATAMAQGSESGGEAGADCCPETSSQSTDADSSDVPGDDDDCCCDDGATCVGDAGDDTVFGHQAVTSSFDESDVEAPNTWWTPDLVATLWVVDRLAETSTPTADQVVETDDVHPDESDTYLQQATLLI